MIKKAPEKDKSERWLLTYADLMNLLLILFIILYSMSKTDVQKATAVAESIREGITGKPTASQVSQSTNSATTSSQPTVANDYSGFYDQLIALIKQSNIANQVDISADSNEIVITLKDTALYSPGSASMNTNSLNLITSIGGLLKQIQYAYIVVEGHTDSDTTKNTQFEDNRDLSSKRANNVARALESVGLKENKILSLGWGEYKPAVPNDTPEHKAQNRRVVLTIVKNGDYLTASQFVVAKDLIAMDSASK